jgi:hypothetical protein
LVAVVGDDGYSGYAYHIINWSAVARSIAFFLLCLDGTLKFLEAQ